MESEICGKTDSTPEEAAEDKKEDDEESAEVKVSDVFLNLENKKPAYLEDAEKAQDEAKDKSEQEDSSAKKEDDDDDDFERDEDFEADVVDEEDNKKDEADNQSKVIKMKVNINVANTNAKKPNSIKEKKVNEDTKKAEAQSTALLDTLFGFIGCQSTQPMEELSST